jgi:hypothetical protein
MVKQHRMNHGKLVCQLSFIAADSLRQAGDISFAFPAIISLETIEPGPLT